MSGRVVTCAANRCERPVKPGMLMCKGHWFSLPKAMQREIWRTWRRFHNARFIRGTDPEAYLQIMADYREAVRAAVDYLESVPPTPADAMATDARRRDGSMVRFRQGRLL